MQAAREDHRSGPGGPTLPSTRSDLRWYALVAAVGLLIAVPVFVRATAVVGETDILTHALLAKPIVESGGWISYSIWYTLVYVLSGGATSLLVTRVVSVAVLSILVVLKGVLVFGISRSAVGSVPWALAITGAMYVITPIGDPARLDAIYLGQISGTIWHNSTTILATVPAIVAFYFMVRLLRAPEWQNAILAGTALLVCVLAKPNYPLALIPAVGVALLLVLVRRRVSVRSSIAVIALAFGVPLAALAYQFATVSSSDIVTGSRLALAPFAVWSEFSPNIPLSLLLSVAGPVLALAAMGPRRRELPVMIAWAVFGVALLQLILLAEKTAEGAVAYSGNWFWGAYIAMTLLMLVSLIALVRSRLDPRTVVQKVILVIAVFALALHVVTGIYYALTIGMDGFPPY